MKDIRDIQTVYFIGIGGIGMSALARYFSFHGKKVSGYDRTESLLTQQLVKEGISVHYQENVDLAPKDADIVIYTPAVPASHAELVYYRQHNYDLLKRSDVLGIITASSFNICVAGTHGKTTISTMMAHVLRDSGYGCNAFLGGISVNYNTNFWNHERNVCVVEADEYDRSFLKLHPDIAVISAMDADHLDIYGTEAVMQDAFVEFSTRLKPDGVLITKRGLARENSFKAPHHITYGLNDTNADVYSKNVKIVDGAYQYDVVAEGWTVSGIRLPMGGMHNVENSIVTVAIAKHLGIDDEKIRAALTSFKGVKRRFEYVTGIGSDESIVLIDDYAHHPEELRALITSARQLFPNRHCTIIFQPHLFSRTRDFAAEFAASLDLADEIVLLPIYPARELPVEGVTSKLILDKMRNRNSRIIGRSELITHLRNTLADSNEPANGLLITAGAGDIDSLVAEIKNIIAGAEKNESHQ
jgi:UDP-N-acetylmuramate--alanine ligase